MGADTFLTISEDCPSSLVEAVSTAAHLGKGTLGKGDTWKTSISLTDIDAGAHAGTGARGLTGQGPWTWGLTQQGLGDSRDRGLGLGAHSTGGHTTGAWTLGLTQRGLGPGANGTGGS